MVLNGNNPRRIKEILEVLFDLELVDIEKVDELAGNKGEPGLGIYNKQRNWTSTILMDNDNIKHP